MMREDTSGLRGFQDGFARALAASDTASMPGAEIDPIARLISQPGFSVYRNTVMKGCIDALQANYPAVSRLVGDEWFRAAAAIFVRENLPQQPTLLEYGDGFAAFLADFGPAAELPYLAGVGLLDRYWTEAHLSRDEVPLEAAAIAGLDGLQLAGAVLTPHASARWMFFPGDKTIPAIWRRSREPDATRDAPAIEWPAGGVLIVRPHDAVETLELDAAGCAFLDACARGCPLSDAAAASLETQPGADLSLLMARLLGGGAFGGRMLPARIPHEDLP